MVETLTPDLKDRNFRNMVDYYKDELRQIIEGKKVGEVFSLKQRRSLRNMKILIFYHAGLRGGVLAVVAPDARALLE